MALTRITTSSRKRWKPSNSWRYWNVDMRWCRRFDRRPRRRPVNKLPANKLPANYWQLRGEKMRTYGIPGLGPTSRAEYLRHVRGLQPSAFRPTRSEDLPDRWFNPEDKLLEARIIKFSIAMFLTFLAVVLSSFAPILGAPLLLAAVFLGASTL